MTSPDDGVDQPTGPAPLMPQPAPLYTRRLPGGGYVTIEQVHAGSGAAYRAQLRVERRTDPLRREGHVAPVVAEMEGAEAQAVLAELHAIAESNVSLAQRIVRWQTRQPRSSERGE